MGLDSLLYWPYVLLMVGPVKEITLQLPFFLFQVGSFFLGITFGFAILFHVASSHAKTSGAEGCLGILICIIGVGVALLCYVAAINV